MWLHYKVFSWFDVVFPILAVASNPTHQIRLSHLPCGGICEAPRVGNFVRRENSAQCPEEISYPSHPLRRNCFGPNRLRHLGTSRSGLHSPLWEGKGHLQNVLWLIGCNPLRTQLINRQDSNQCTEGNHQRPCRKLANAQCSRLQNCHHHHHHHHHHQHQPHQPPPALHLTSPHNLTSSHLATNHMTSYPITSQQITSSSPPPLTHHTTGHHQNTTKYDKLNPTVSKAAAAHHIHWRSPCLSQGWSHHEIGYSLKWERLSRLNEAGVDQVTSPTHSWPPLACWGLGPGPRGPAPGPPNWPPALEAISQAWSKVWSRRKMLKGGCRRR